MTADYSTEKVTELIAELRGFAEGSESARASLMRDAAAALEAEHKRAESLTIQRDTARRESIEWESAFARVEVERDELRAVIAEALEAATRTMHPEQPPTRCGVCRIERLLTEYGKQKEADRD